MHLPDQQKNSRRVFLKNGTFILASTLAPSLPAAVSQPASMAGSPSKPAVTLGLMTDMHYADKPTAGSRHYRETPQKLEEAGRFLEQERPDFLVELGDFIDAASSVDTELRYLKSINKQFSQLCPNRHYVLGNHCVDTLKKREFLDVVEQPKSYYSFDQGGLHFVVLDACFRSDGTPYERKNFQWTDANIPPQELEWLKADLEATSHPVVVFAHQRLDPSGNHGVRNNASVRVILEQSRRVVAVFQGHSHKNNLQTINGIHYCTAVAMVEGSGLENSGCSLLKIEADGTIALTGFRRQQSYSWSA